MLFLWGKTLHHNYISAAGVMEWRTCSRTMWARTCRDAVCTETPPTWRLPAPQGMFPPTTTCWTSVRMNWVRMSVSSQEIVWALAVNNAAPPRSVLCCAFFVCLLNGEGWKRRCGFELMHQAATARRQLEWQKCVRIFVGMKCWCCGKTSETHFDLVWTDRDMSGVSHGFAKQLPPKCGRQ